MGAWTIDWALLDGYKCTLHLLEGKYYWMEGRTTWFPAFQNLFRKNDKYENFERQTNQAAGVFLRWLWKDSKAEIYVDYQSQRF